MKIPPLERRKSKYRRTYLSVTNNIIIREIPMLKSVLPLLRIDTKTLFILYFAHTNEIKVSEISNILGLNRKEIIQVIQRLKKDGYIIEYDKEKDTYKLLSDPVIDAYIKIENVDRNTITGQLFGIIPCRIKTQNPNKYTDNSIVKIKGLVEIHESTIYINEQL